MRTRRVVDYDEKIRRVCDYIHQNMDDALGLDELSRVAALSKYHFHRVFSASTGVSLSRFIQLARLKRASLHLAFKTDVRIIDAALDAGFESPEAFSRAFKRAFGQTPSRFRKAPDWAAWHNGFRASLPQGPKDMHVKIVDFADTKVALIEHRGAPDRVFDTAAKFIQWRKDSRLSPAAASRTYGIAHCDPNTTPAEEFRFDFCGTVDRDVPENAHGVRTGHIPGGRCAVVEHKGSHDRIVDSVYYLYRDWLPRSGEECRDFPCFFHYRNFIHEVAECDLLTDIYLPLK